MFLPGFLSHETPRKVSEPDPVATAVRQGDASASDALTLDPSKSHSAPLNAADPAQLTITSGKPTREARPQAASKEHYTVLRKRTGVSKKEYKLAHARNNTVSKEFDPTEYEIERIVKHRQLGNKQFQYFIKWIGYPESENTWQFADTMHQESTLRDYWATQPKDVRRPRKYAKTATLRK
jgi:hypothetical protein